MASIALPSWRGRWSSRPERVAGVFCRRPDLFRKTVPWRADGWDNAEYTMIATGASRLPAMAAAVLMQSHKKSPTDMKQDPRFPNLFITDHPLIQHKLSHMRERDTSTRTFRELLKEITLLMGYEITRDLPLTTRQIETQLLAGDDGRVASHQRRFDLAGRQRQIAVDFVAHQQGDFLEQLAEGTGGRVALAHVAQFVLDQRMVGDEEVGKARILFHVGWALFMRLHEDCGRHRRKPGRASRYHGVFGIIPAIGAPGNGFAK